LIILEEVTKLYTKLIQRGVVKKVGENYKLIYQTNDIDVQQKVLDRYRRTDKDLTKEIYRPIVRARKQNQSLCWIDTCTEEEVKVNG
jgi:uncharacterized protein YwgA